MKFVITKIKGCIDGLEGLKVYVDFLLLSFVCDNGAAVQHEAIGGHFKKSDSAVGALSLRESRGLQATIKRTNICRWALTSVVKLKALLDRGDGAQNR